MPQNDGDRNSPIEEVDWTLLLLDDYDDYGDDIQKHHSDDRKPHLRTR